MENQFDQAVELQLDLFRASREIDRDVLKLLLKLEKDLLAEIASAKYTEWGRRRVNQQIAQVRELIKAYYGQVSVVATKGSSAIAEVSALATGKSLDNAVLPTLSMLEAIAGRSVIQGAAQGAWWAKQSDDLAFRFAQAVRQGLAGSETNQQIIARVRNFLDTSRHGAAALVQTSVATVANDARQAVFGANEDIIKKYRAIATLDSHTCMRCAPLDGLEWKPDGSPIDHKYPKPTYPLHFNCRCLLLPIVFDVPQGGQRASDEGPVSAQLTFRGWLERQSKEKQDQILGEGRAELYRAGKITLNDLVQGGRPLSLAALKRKYA